MTVTILKLSACQYINLAHVTSWRTDKGSPELFPHPDDERHYDGITVRFDSGHWQRFALPDDLGGASVEDVAARIEAAMSALATQ